MSLDASSSPSDWDNESDYLNQAPSAGLNPFDSLTQPQNFDLNTVAPVFGMVGEPAGADYLDYNVRGRPWSERMMFTTGVSYLSGIMLGGAIGVVEGVRNAPSNRFKIQLNSVLNACGKRGSRSGNAFGALALFYSSFEGLADIFDADRYVAPYDKVVPIAAAAATGAIYKCTAGPRPMALAAVLGASAMAGFTALQPYLN